MNRKISLILGQTATGKTAMATLIASGGNIGELLNCDSRQIYRHLDIITGKSDNPKDTSTHAVDIIDPSEPFSAYEYATLARKIIDDVLHRDKLPIVVGGTGMYAYILKYLDPSTPTPNIKPSKIYDSHTIEELQKLIQEKYNFIWDRLTDSDKKNKRRLASAIHRLTFTTSQPINKQSKHCIANMFQLDEVILLHKDQSALELRLRHRVQNRLDMGAVAECQKLLDMGYKPTDPGLATIGYQTIFSYLAGRLTEKEMMEEWFVRERQYAKRQKTYFLKYFPTAKVEYV